MKKKFSFLMVALLGIVGFTTAAFRADAVKLIDYPTSEAGITLSGTTTISTVKIHENADAVTCIKLSNGYTTDGALNDNYVKLTVEGGFKKGDIVSIAGAINNSDESKRGAVDIFTVDAENKISVLSTTQDFINGRLTTADPVADSYTLEADAAELYLGRNGNTGTNITLLTVTRPAAEEEAGPEKFYIMGNGTPGGWNATTEMTYNAETKAFEYELTNEGSLYFTFGDAEFTGWDDFNANHRYAIGEGDQNATVGTAMQLQKANGTLVLSEAGKFLVSVTKDLQCTITKQEDVVVENKVVILGSFNEWNQDDVMTQGEGNVWTKEIDATAITDDIQFKLLVNGNWHGNGSALTIDAPEGWVTGQTDGDWNYILNNSTTGYQTYTVTASCGEEFSTDAAAWTLKIEGKDARPVPATDIAISPAEGDIYAALAAAEEGVELIGNISINLTAGVTYTVSAPLVAHKNFEIQANGATIDASELNGNLIEMAATAEVPAEAVNIEYVSIHNATVKGLKKALFYSTQAKYLINWLTIDNSIIEVAADATTIDFTKKSAARNVNIENSTIYAPTATTKSFYSSQSGEKLTELDAEGIQTFIVKNSTMYNLAKTKNFFTHRQNNQKWLAYNVENSLFVNCGKSGQTIKGLNGGGSSTNPTWTINGNAFNFEADGVMTDTSAAEDTGDTTEGEGVQNSVAGVVTFTDAANGDFNGEFELAEGAEAPEALGDGRWTITFKGGAEVETTYYLVGTFNNWTASDDYKLTLNENANEGVVEYMLTLDIPANSSMKVLDNIGNWYPATSPDFVVNDEGNYTVYFRPNADGDEFWFEGCIYCNYNGVPSGINTVKADDLKNAEIFNLNGQCVQNAQKGLYIVNGRKVVIK